MATQEVVVLGIRIENSGTCCNGTECASLGIPRVRRDAADVGRWGGEGGRKRNGALPAAVMRTPMAGPIPHTAYCAIRRSNLPARSRDRLRCRHGS